jgi:hypothetical protein
LPAKPTAMVPPVIARSRSRICSAAAMPSQGVMACSMPGSFLMKRPPVAITSASFATSPAVVCTLRPSGERPVTSAPDVAHLHAGEEGCQRHDELLARAQAAGNPDGAGQVVQLGARRNQRDGVLATARAQFARRRERAKAAAQDGDALASHISRLGRPRPPPRAARRVGADQQPVVTGIAVRRHLQVGRGRLVLVHPACPVEGGAVAGAEEAARPVGRHAGVVAAGRHVAGRAAQVGADADGHEDLGPMARAALRRRPAVAAADAGRPGARRGPAARPASPACAARSTPACRAIPRSCMPPGGMSPMSTSTGPPAALARSLGAKVDTKGTAVASAAAPPAAPVAMSHRRLAGSGDGRGGVDGRAVQYAVCSFSRM